MSPGVRLRDSSAARASALHCSLTWALKGSALCRPAWGVCEQTQNSLPVS